MNKQKWKPIIIIGAGRSGTSILQKVIGTHPKIVALTPDLNFIWRYNNQQITHDQLEPQNADAKVKIYIWKYFNNNVKNNEEFVVEKSVCNTIRIPFVYEVFPDAKYIYIERDGIDVIASVKSRWGKIRGRSYLIKKIKAFPKLGALFYGIKYAINLLKIKLFNQPAKGYIWGVKYPQYEVDLKNKDVLSVIMKQWQTCIEKAEKDLNLLEENQLLKLKYEEMVKHPDKVFKKIGDFLMVKSDLFDISEIRSDAIGSYHKHLSKEEISNVRSLVESVTETKAN